MRSLYRTTQGIGHPTLQPELICDGLQVTLEVIQVEKQLKKESW